MKNIKLTVELNRVYFKSEPKGFGTFWAAVNFKYVHKEDCTSFLPGGKNVGYITVTGNFYEIPEAGQTLDIIVEKEAQDHPKYGPQYKLKQILLNIDFTNPSAIKNFLLAILTEGQYESLKAAGINIGKALQEGNVEELCKAKGIKEVTANKLIERFRRNQGRAVIIEALHGVDVYPSVIEKMEHMLNSDSAIIDIITNHPYRLIGMIDGVGFKTADRIALSRGLDKGSCERIEAYINYKLFSLGEEGQSYVGAGELTNMIFTELGSRREIFREYTDEDGNVIDNNINKALKRMQDKNLVVVEEATAKSERRVYLSYYYNLEARISNDFKRLLSQPNTFVYDDWESRLKMQEEKQGWEYTDEQKEGIKTALDNNVVLITGNAGSGKSSIVSGVLACLPNYTVAQCALAGKAAARLQEATNSPASTIHRLLKYKMGAFLVNRNQQLAEDIIVVDEVSMIDGELFYKLIQSIHNGSKLILLGDMAQLESIGSLNIISDLFKSEYIPKATLTKIHRQAQSSGILTSSLKVRDKEQIFEKGFTGFAVLGEDEDMNIDINKDNVELLDKVVETFKKQFNSPLVNKDINKIQIITPMKKRGPVSTVKVNNKIQELYNPPQKGVEEVAFLEYTEKDENGEDVKIYSHFRPNDKIMCVRNHYAIFSIDGGREDIFNGWVGTFKGVEEACELRKFDETETIRVTVSYLKKNSKTLGKEFPIVSDTFEVGVFSFPFLERDVMIKKEDIEDYFSLGYASTVHKMQGSEYPCVIGAVDGFLPPFMGTKELLYTLITRAKKNLTLIGHGATLRRTINTSFISSKKTFLAEFLDSDGDIKEIEVVKENKDDVIK